MWKIDAEQIQQGQQAWNQFLMKNITSKSTIESLIF